MTAAVGTLPYPLYGEEQTYDPVSGDLLLVQPYSGPTGYAEATYELVAGGWLNLTSSLSTSPPPLSSPGFAFDLVDGYAVLFGGDRISSSGATETPSNLTWAFGASGWRNLTTSTAPPSGGPAGAVLADDAGDGYLLMFLTCASGCATAQTWSFSAGTWTKISTTNIPPERSHAVLSDDPWSGTVVLTGGVTSSNADLNDTWAYVADTWTNETATAGNAPEGGELNGLSADTNDSVLLVEGGWRLVCVAVVCFTVPFQGLWSFSSGAWQNLTATQSGVPPSGGQGFTYEASHGEGVLSGVQQGTSLASTWVVREKGPPLVVAAPSQAPGRVDEGVLVNLSVVLSGGYGWDQLSWGGLPAGCSSANQTWVACRPSTTGSFDISVNATDEHGDMATSPTLVLTVASDPTLGPVVVTRPTVTEGAELWLSVAGSGGIGPGTFAWPLLPPGCTSANLSALPCVPDRAGTYPVHVNYTDLAGLVATSSGSVVVNPLVTITSFTASPSPNGTVGSTLELKAAAAGGTGPLSFVYSGLPAGCTGANSSTLNCTPSSPGSVTVHLYVVDRDGRGANASVNLVIASAPKGASPSAGLLELAALLVVGLGVVLLLLVLFVRRRRTVGAVAVAGDGHDLAPPVHGPLGQGPPEPPAPPDLPRVDSDTGPNPPGVPPPWEEESAPSEPPGAGSIEGPPPPAPDLGPRPPPPVPRPFARRPQIAGPPPTALSPPKGDAVCVVCGGQGVIDPATGKYYCPRCDRRY